jgi:Tol biopolymer transport system component
LANNIAFTASTRGGYQVALYDLASRKSQFVTSGGGSYSQPRWLNDGRHLVATLSTRGQQTLWIIDTETGKKTKLPSGRLTNISQPDFVYPQ